MYWLFHIGQYYIIIVPFVAGLAVAGLARLMVGRGHCRNRLVAWVTGGFLGLFLYLGSYVVGMIHTFGPETAATPQRLAFYIRLRLATDVVKDGCEREGEEATSHRNGAEWANRPYGEVGRQ